MPTDIGRQDVQRLLAEGIPVVEVLPKDEYDAEHIAGALSIPLGELDAETTAGMDRSRPVVVYCYNLE